jgi:recombination protein RecA
MKRLSLLQPATLAEAKLDAAPDLAWNLDALSGRLVELSGSQSAARLSAAFGLVLEAQLRADRAAWVTLKCSSFFPPDVADGGVDLEALPIVRVPDARAAGRAADHLVRSNAFGLVVLDLSSGPLHAGHTRRRPREDDHWPVTLPMPLLTRLLGLARAHDVAMLILTRKSSDAPSLNSLISLRAEAQWAGDDGQYEVRICVLKDKRGGPGWTHLEACRGPAGVR